MSLLNEKADEILELCLAKESPQMKAKVYEILSLSGIQANDPMFLVLALTGQMRIFLEAAPQELNQQLQAWESQSNRSMNELTGAIARVKEAQQQHVENIRQSVHEINSKNVDDIRNLYQSLVSEILKSNIEVERTIQLSVEEVKKVHEQLNAFNVKLQTERSTNIKVMKSLIEGLNKTTKDFELVNTQIYSSVATLEQLKVSKFVNKGMILGAFISVFVFGSLLTLGLIKLVDAEPLGITPINSIVAN